MSKVTGIYRDTCHGRSRMHAFPLGRLRGEQRCPVLRGVVNLVEWKERKSAVIFSGLADRDIPLLSTILSMYSSDIFTVPINRGILIRFRNVTNSSYSVEVLCGCLFVCQI